jgi:ABC-type antimicrobial peptide transport system permease subunit
MALLARRNLFHDKIWLAVTLTGIVFAVVLITVQLGLFTGFATTTSNIIDHSGADLWIAAKSKMLMSTRLLSSRKTQIYWMFTTGAGVAVLIAAALGLMVAIVVVAQTIYATTIDHLREYGTLKAMGASNGYIYRMIIKQAIISAA